MMKSLSWSAIFLLGLVNGQSTTTSTSPDPNSDFYQSPSQLINFPGCYQDLVTADRNGDGLVKIDEYLGFIQEYAGNRKCIQNPELTLQQRVAFNTIACGCRAEQGASSNCCIGNNAQIRTAGALNPLRTATEDAYLTSACRITDATLGPSQCPPQDGDRNIDPIPPLPDMYVVPPPPRPPEDDSPPNWLWALIAAILLLLLCCCCVFVLRRKKSKEMEEEAAAIGKGGPPAVISANLGPQQSQQVANNLPNDNEEQPGAVEPRRVIPTGAAAGDDDDEDEEEARKRRGGGPITDEEEEDGRKRYGAPRLPPPEKETPSFKLRPVPPKEKEEDPEWDHPGRPFDYPKEKDEMSAGEVEHYEPDGGVYLPKRSTKDPIQMNPQWERSVPVDPNENDTRKHRIQSGLGEGEVWDQLDKGSEAFSENTGGGGGFDWVVSSALGVLDQNDAAAHSLNPRNARSDHI